MTTTITALTYRSLLFVCSQWHYAAATITIKLNNSNNDQTQQQQQRLTTVTSSLRSCVCIRRNLRNADEYSPTGKSTKGPAVTAVDIAEGENPWNPWKTCQQEKMHVRICDKRGGRWRGAKGQHKRRGYQGPSVAKEKNNSVSPRVSLCSKLCFTIQSLMFCNTSVHHTRTHTHTTSAHTIQTQTFA